MSSHKEDQAPQAEGDGDPRGGPSDEDEMSEEIEVASELSGEEEEGMWVRMGNCTLCVHFVHTVHR